MASTGCPRWMRSQSSPMEPSVRRAPTMNYSPLMEPSHSSSKRISLMNKLMKMKTRILNVSTLASELGNVISVNEGFIVTLCTYSLKLYGTVAHQRHLALGQCHYPLFTSYGCLDNVTYPLWHHNGCLLWRHCTIVMHHISWMGQWHLHLKNNILYVANLSKTTGLWYSILIDFVSWILFV